MDIEIEKFFDKLSKEKKEVTIVARDFIIKSFPEISESIKWNQLTFHIKKLNIAFIYTYNTVSYMNLGFFNAISLHDPNKLFEGTGKQMRHIKLEDKKKFPKAQVKKWITETIDIAGITN